MGLQPLSLGDIQKSVNKAGISGVVRASQVIEAVQLYIQGEVGFDAEKVEPISVREGVLVVRTSHPAYAEKLLEHQEEITQYLLSATGVEIERIQFIV